MISKRDRRFFDVASAMARTSTHKKARVGCVVTSGSVIVSVGVNGIKTHPMQERYDILRKHSGRHILHAEIDAVRKLRSQADRIYIYRTRNGTQGMARPCLACMGALRDYGILDVYYTTNEGFCYERISDAKV